MERRMAVGAAAASLAVLAIATQYSIDQGLISWRALETGRQAGEQTAEPQRRVAVEETEVDEAAPAPDARREVTTALGEMRDADLPASEQESVPVAKLMPAPQVGGRSRIAPASPPVERFQLSEVPQAHGLASNAARSVAQQGFAVAPTSSSDRIAPLPPELDGRDRFTEFDANPVHTVAEDPVSTFSIDIDTASYAFVRRMLREGKLPPADAVRVEEMINYFDYSYLPAESREEPFRPTVAVYPTPWNTDTKLVQIGIKGFEVASDAKPRANLVFLIDVSGSMESTDKLPLLKSAFRLLLDNLEPEDTVSIVTYAGEAGTALEPTEVAEKRKILSAIDKLGAGGSTTGAAGIEAAYDLAEDAFVEDGVNRVILATDGDFNVGMSDPDQLEEYIERKRESGIYLSVLGFGAGNYNDALMQSLAQSGNGNAAYIDTLNEARKVLVDEAGSTIVPIAGDVKIQVEFNPATVAEYRLIGYETRALNREDFNNDRVDAGDIGSGHTVTALYELTPVDSPARLVSDLRYQPELSEAVPSGNDEYAFLRLRYKLPGENRSNLIERPITPEDESKQVESAGDDMRFAAAVAAFGQKLRGGVRLGDYDYEDIASLAAGARGNDPFGYRNEFLTLVRLAGAIDDTGGQR